MMPSRVSAIILAGRRPGRIDPLAEAHAVSDKCLVPINGAPLIEHVVATLAASPLIARIVVSVNEPVILQNLPNCAALMASNRLLAIASSSNLADSVIAAAAAVPLPAIITTADNVLLTQEGIVTLINTAIVQKADAAAAFARKRDILAAHADGQRRFYEFADDGYSNCNCYWIAGVAALKAAEIFRSGGQFAKNPMRIASAFGLLNLIRFRLGIGTLDNAMRNISQRIGLSLVPVIMSDGALAIDVDNERTYAVASAILERRSKAGIAA